MINLFMVYSFLRALTKPFVKWKAYQEGVIDKDGKVLIPPKERTPQQKKTFTAFDRLVWNIKNMLAKLPGGDKQIATYAAALYLIKEHNQFREGHVLLEANEIDVDLFMEEVSNSIGSGSIAGVGAGDPSDIAISKTAAKKYRDRNKATADLLSKRSKKGSEDVKETNGKN